MNAPTESLIPDRLEQVRARVAERFPADLERIGDHLRLPSVSATGYRALGRRYQRCPRAGARAEVADP